MNEWKLENQLNDEEIEMILDNDIATAKELVYQKQQEAEIYIGYLRKEADRLESQLDLLETRLQQMVSQEFIDKMNALSKGKAVNKNRARMMKLRAVSQGRQHLIKKH